jgi:serine/threonine-protein kinase RsbT
LVVDRSEVMPVRSAEDVVRVRQQVRSWAVGLGFSLVEQTKIVTAASEIARNTIDYGGGGELRLESVRQSSRRGLKLVFTDQGPGIADLQQALSDGFTTGGGLGLGLGGSKRLCNEFDIRSAPGAGTTVTLVRWK